MPDWSVTLLSTLIGAAVAIATVVIQQRASQKAAAAQRRNEIATRYLFQLQDAADSLWFRVENLRKRGGASWMDAHDPLYREATTFYALGRYLAVDRMLTLDGVWPELRQISPKVAKLLRERRLDETVLKLFHYDRLALGETVLERDENGFRTSTYLDFRRRFDTGTVAPEEWRERVWRTLRDLPPSTYDALLGTLEAVATALEPLTGIESAVARRRRAAAASSA